MQNLSLILLILSIIIVFLFLNDLNLPILIGSFIWYLIVVGIGVSIVLHRELSHNSLIVNKFFRNFVLTIFTATTAISPCSWVVVHKTHHKFSDKEFDPHPPTAKGIFNNIIGNIQVPKKEGIIFSKSILINEYINFLHRHNNKVSILLLIILTFLGPSYLLAWALVFLGYKIQSILNAYLAHKVGYRNFDLKNDSTNEPITTIISFGEGLHNNHHANPSNPNFSYKSFEIDIGFKLIQLFQKIKLVQIK